MPKVNAPAGENRMGTAKMLPLIFSMALPAMFSMLIQALYNIVDSYYVAQISQDALTAVSLAFPIQSLIVAFAVGTSVGTSSLISRRLGERDQKAADSAATHGIVLELITWVLFATICAIIARPFFAMYSEDPDVLEMGTTYLTIVCVFSFGMFVANCIEKTLQATGNMILPMIMQLVGAVTNILLDPVFIFGYFGLPALGVAGAAIATVAGQILSMTACLLIFFLGKHRVRIRLRGFRFSGKTVKDIYVVALPSIFMQSIGTVMTMSINGILSRFTPIAVNVFGVYFKLQSFVFMPVFGLNQGLMPIMGYNFGARNRKRVMSALKNGVAIAASIMVVGCIVFETVPNLLLSIFSPTEEMYRVGIPALRSIAIHFPIAAVSIMITNLFQATGHGIYSLIQSIMRQLGVLIPAAWLLSFVSLDAVWLAFPIAELLSLVVTLVLFVRLYRREIATLDQRPLSAPANA